MDTPIPEAVRNVDPPFFDDVMAQCVRFSVGPWRAAFPDGPIADVLSLHADGHITRREMLEAATRARESGWIAGELRHAVAATMLWGIGSGNAGRGFDWAHRLFADVNLDTTLARVTQMLEVGDVPRAYLAARSLLGIREPFFTKVLYSLGTAARCAPQPLTLDSRVRNALKAVGYVYGRRGQRRELQYATWVTDMHRWAAALGCRSDQIEFALFELCHQPESWALTDTDQTVGPEVGGHCRGPLGLGSALPEATGRR